MEYVLLTDKIEIEKIIDGDKEKGWYYRNILKENLEKSNIVIIKKPKEPIVIDNLIVNGKECIKVNNVTYAFLKEDNCYKIDIKYSKANIVRYLDESLEDGYFVPNEKAKIEFFFREFNITNKQKVKFTFYKLGTDEQIEVKDYKQYFSVFSKRIEFIMPEFNIELREEIVNDENKIKLCIDDSNITELESNSALNYVTEAIYSDLYDLGIEDHYFIERNILFQRGTKLKVVLFLKKMTNIYATLNNKRYKLRCSISKVNGEDGVEQMSYLYTFSPVIFDYEDTLKFILEE